MIAIEDENLSKPIENNTSPIATFKTSGPIIITTLKTSDPDDDEDDDDDDEPGSNPENPGFIEEHLYLIIIGASLAGVVLLVVIIAIVISIRLNVRQKK